jgi:cytochrome o ubiquinol oxidase subunit 1
MIGLIIAALAFLFGFGMVWHMWWAVPVALIGIFATVVVRSFARETEFVISAVEVEASESHHTRL